MSHGRSYDNDRRRQGTSGGNGGRNYRDRGDNYYRGGGDGGRDNYRGGGSNGGGGSNYRDRGGDHDYQSRGGDRGRDGDDDYRGRGRDGGSYRDGEDRRGGGGGGGRSRSRSPARGSSNRNYNRDERDGGRDNRGGRNGGRGGGGGGGRGRDRGRDVDRGRGRGRDGDRGGDRYNTGGSNRNNMEESISNLVEDTETTAAEDALVQNFRQGVNQESELPLRPGYGTAGTAVLLRTNYLSFTRLPQGPLYEYRISYEPEAKAKHVRARLLELLAESPEFEDYKEYTSHDSSERLVATQELYPRNGNPLKLQIQYSKKDVSVYISDCKIYTLTFSLTAQLSRDDINNHISGVQRQNTAPYISALEILLAKSASKKGLRVKRNCYVSREAQDLARRIEALRICRGFYSSIRLTLNSLMINVNVCYAAFYKEQSLSNALDQFVRDTGDNTEYAASRFADRLRVVTTDDKHRERTVCGIRYMKDYTFECDYGVVTVEKFWFLRHNRRPNTKWIANVGQPHKPVYWPADILDILPDQVLREKSLEYYAADMISITSQRPVDNKNFIVKEGLESMGFSGSDSTELEQFGISVGNQLAVVPARVLPPPALLYKRDNPATIARDKASWNLKGVSFYRGQELKRWGVFLIRTPSATFSGPHDSRLKNSLRQFSTVLRNSGLQMTGDRPDHIFDVKLESGDSSHNHRTLYNTLKNEAIDSRYGLRFNFLLVVLSDNNKRVYAAIRRICDVELGIPATCVQSAKIKDGSVGYNANVALKINAKLGGVNHVLHPSSAEWLLQESTMLVGMDVTHPGPGSIKGTPSIAGVVASYDTDCAIYPASLRLQKTKQEMIEDLAGMMIERLEHFRSLRKELPKRIVIFRDGVSDGQFSTVLSTELPRIRDALKRMGVSYTPKISIIICGKRHHTRFYPPLEVADSTGNAKPGTVVERKIMPVFDFDFFLQAHHSIQGTGRPTHYTVIYDENSFTPDVIQGLVNNASYMYARATRAVSLVPPAYYADLACERGRLYIQELLNGSGNDLSHASEDDVYREAERLWCNGIHSRIASTMFYI